MNKNLVLIVGGLVFLSLIAASMWVDYRFKKAQKIRDKYEDYRDVVIYKDKKLFIKSIGVDYSDVEDKSSSVSPYYVITREGEKIPTSHFEYGKLSQRKLDTEYWTILRLGPNGKKHLMKIVDD